RTCSTFICPSLQTLPSLVYDLRHDSTPTTSYGVEDSQAKPFVDAAFALVAGHADAADLARTRHVRPAVGLQVETYYLDYAHLLDAFRQQVDPGADQIGDSEGLSARQTAHAYLMVRRDLGVGTRLDLGGEVGAHALQLEVHACAAGLHRSARDGCAVVAPDDAAQH